VTPRERRFCGSPICKSRKDDLVFDFHVGEGKRMADSSISGSGREENGKLGGSLFRRDGLRIFGVGSSTPEPWPGVLSSEHPLEPRAGLQLRQDPSACGPLVNLPGRTNLELVQRCRVRTARAANPSASGASLMASEKQIKESK
jgi:hypothetical protein